jgi:pimeloyl-ACP methyl ester carboxylesterase
MANKENRIKAGKFEWFYRESAPLGSAKSTVILLHGLVSQSYGWRKVLPSLAEAGFRAIAPDWIGSGFSEKPDRRDFAYTPDAFIAALQDFLQALEISQCSLVVQGSLGSIGLQSALRHPEQIDRIAILNSPITTAVQLPWKIRQMGIPLVGDMMTQDPLLVDRTLEGGGGYRVDDNDLDVYRRPFLKSSDAGRSLLATIKNLEIKEATAEIEAGFGQWQKPVLVAWGDRDPWLPMAIAESFVNRLPNATLEKLEEVGHYPQEDWHEKVSNVLIPFLRRQSAS